MNNYTRMQINKKYFTVKYTEFDTLFNYQRNIYISNFTASIKSNSNTSIFRYVHDTSDIHFENCSIEIQYPFRRFKNSNFRFDDLLFLKCLICVKSEYLNNEWRCFYIISADSISKNGINVPYIGKQTYIVYTNLPDIIIHKLFPLYQGKIIDGGIYEIIVNHNIPTWDYNFYKAINLKGFDRYFNLDTLNLAK